MTSVNMKMTGRPGDTVIQLDGVDVAPGASGFSLTGHVRDIPLLELEIPVHNVSEVNAEDVRVVMPASTTRLLLNAGWTPPATGDGITPQPAPDYDALDTAARHDLPPDAAAIAHTLDEWLQTHHGIFSSHACPGHFLRILAEHGYTLRRTAP